jgi:hypothetical protein
MRKIFFSASRQWVGDSQQDATHFANIPDANDPRWIKGNPSILDTTVLTLSPFYPSMRLDVCCEHKSSKKPIMQPNHPPFAGCVAWMSLDAIERIAISPEKIVTFHSN